MTNVQYPVQMMDYHRAGAGFQPSGYGGFQRKPMVAGQYSQYAQPQQHSRTRTTSSNVLPSMTPSSTLSSMSQASPTYRDNRRASTATTSTTSTGGQMARSGTNNSNIRRSTSSRSSSSPSSYVALMRKQKATVWCDRSQLEDPRLAAAARAAKQRAVLEVHGGPGRAAGSGSAKIKHGGKTTYLPANMTGAGVPVRLSANEIGTNEDELDDGGSGGMQHRTGSGRSSLNSNRYPSGYPRQSTGRFSTSSTPPNEGVSPNISEEGETPVPLSSKPDYFEKDTGSPATLEREDSFGEVKEMSGPNAIAQAAENAKKAEELRRRGSVDERTMTISAQRLFVANPDLDD